MGQRKNLKIKNKKTESWRNKTIWTDQITIKETKSVLKNLPTKIYQDYKASLVNSTKHFFFLKQNLNQLVSDWAWDSAFFYLYLFIYLFMAVLGLHFCARAFSSCGKWGPLFITVHGPLIIAASLVAEHRLQTRRLSNCGSWA